VAWRSFAAFHRKKEVPKMAEPILEARGIIKTFGHVHALRGANFAAHPGEVVALVGDNGAGKSTLAKCLSGVYQPDAGETLLEGRQVRLSSPVAALHLGIETVYQDLALADDLEASANLFLGRELTMGGRRLRWLGILDQRRMRTESALREQWNGKSRQGGRATRRWAVS
jgi:simple sugar transport system ATP-binding protein